MILGDNIYYEVEGKVLMGTLVHWGTFTVLTAVDDNLVPIIETMALVVSEDGRVIKVDPENIYTKDSLFINQKPKS